MRPEEIILDAQRVIGRFGGWPDFHDAEMVAMHLDRRGRLGPTLEFVVFACGYSGVVLPSGYYERTNLSLITFRCDGVDESELVGFNHQNVLDGLHFEKLEKCVKVQFSSIFGVGGSVTCHQVTAVDVIAATEDAEPAQNL